MSGAVLPVLLAVGVSALRFSRGVVACGEAITLAASGQCHSLSELAERAGVI